jgi:hypothetical protein
MLTGMMFLLLLQDAGSVVIAPATIDPSVDVQGFFDTVETAVETGNWQAAAAMALILGVYLSRKLAKKIPAPVGPWLLSDRGGAASVVLMGVLGGVTTSLLAGHKMSLHLLYSGLTTGVLASGMRNMAWTVLFPGDKKQPTAGLVSMDPPKPPAA